MRTIHTLEQGSPEWHAHRNTPGMVNGSEISAIVGLSSYTTRSELVRQKATGIVPEVDAEKQKRFDLGHLFEALARPLAENVIEDDLSPLVMSDEFDGVLISVSLDGITQGKGTTFEHKTLKDELRVALEAGDIPDEYHFQMEAGLMVSGAARCLFMASKWKETEPGNEDWVLVDVRHAWYESRPELRPRIIAACKQFLEDVKNYQHVEVADRPAPQVSIELPALFVQAQGQITASNMKEYGAALATKLAEVRAIQLVSDQDFSNADAAADLFRRQIKNLQLTKEAMLSQTATIGEAVRMIDAWSEDLRVTALQLEKDVKRRDREKKDGMVLGANAGYADHIRALNARIGGNWMPNTKPDFAAALKSKRSYTSMQDSVNTALANAKAEASMTADTIEANRKSLIGEAHDWMFLFPDFAAVCTKDPEDFSAILFQRQQQDEQRKDAERERIRQEEAAKLAAEAKRADEAKAKEQAAPAPLVSEGTTTPAQPIRQAATPEQKQAAVIEHQDEIAEFMASREWGKDAGKIRAVLVEFVKFQASKNLAVAA